MKSLGKRARFLSITFTPTLGISGTVTFTYGLSDGAASDTAMVAVAVTTPASGADFVGDPLIGSAPLTVSFTDMSGGNPTTWSLR